MKKFRKRITTALTAAVVGVTSAVAGFSTAISADAADENYIEALQMSLYFYDANQCGGDVGENPLTWRDDCHMQDATASLDNAQGLSSASKSAIQAQNGGANTVDVSGGYHDAGDHIKFSMTMGFGATSLAWSYFTYPDAYEKANCTDHLLYVLENFCDYFMKVTYLDSNDDVIAFCYQVAAEGEDHSTWTAPETQTMTRTTYWADSSHAQADASGQMAAALAASSLAFRKNGNTAYADECLKYAQALEKFTEKYPTVTNDGCGSMYASSSQKDDIAWSDLWVALAGNNGTLPSSYSPAYKLTANGCYNNSEYDYYMYTWDKVWGGYSALLAEVGYDTTTYVNEMKFELSNQGGLSTSSYNAAGWGASRYNCALQMVANHIADATSDSSYAEAAKHQMDVILGNNSTGYSFLLGYGDKWATRIHHRAANPGTGNPQDNTEATYTAYGCLVGGMDGSGNYSDEQNSYQFTEPALDYNGCFALAIAALASKYGGDASVFPAKLASIAEIDENYDFGGGSTPTTTTETTTTTTTTEATTTETTTTTTTTEATTTETTTTTTTEATTTETTTTTTTTTDPSQSSDTTTTTTTTTETKPTETTTTQGGEVLGNVWLAGQAGSYQYWNKTDAGQEPAEVTGDGTYTVRYNITDGDGTGSIECLILQSDFNIYSFAPEGSTNPLEECGINFTIDKITLDGVEIAYTGPTDGALCTDNDGVSLRLNILNTWTSPKISDINGSEISLTDVMEVTFTVSGLPGYTDTTTPTMPTTTKSDPTTTTTTTTITTTTTESEPTTTPTTSTTTKTEPTTTPTVTTTTKSEPTPTTTTTTNTTKSDPTTTTPTSTTTKAPDTTTTTSTTTDVPDNVTIGDVNMDGDVNLKDIILLNKYIAKMVTLNDTQLKAAACKDDGTINSDDLIALMSYVVELVEALPVK